MPNPEISDPAISNPKLLQWRALGKNIQLGDERFFYRDEGTGPVLLKIHGFPMSSWDWTDILPALSQRYRVIALDMLGYGFSEKPAGGDYSTAAQAQRHMKLA